MPSDCSEILYTVHEVLGRVASGPGFSVQDAETAYLHVRRCTVCRESLTTEEHWAFLRQVISERE